MLAVGMKIGGFRVESCTGLPDVNGRLWRMTFVQNGADLVWLERPDAVKTFVIAFKTLPEDDTGVAHILEHSVLAGSEKYPVKSPFDELRKSSLRVFMNAMTARDRTYYPFSTRNDQDFLNLAEVYLDAVFHPLAVRTPLAFQQEGWHYEFVQGNAALCCNGVVYNEMKGVFADPEQTAAREILHDLYPDTVYGNDSGGKPEAIPHLTFEKFCAFHRKFYHPSNARIFLDGSVDLPAILEKLDACFKDFPRREKIPPIPCQKPVRQCRTVPYASTAGTGHTILADAWSAGISGDPVHLAALEILTEYLAGSNEAPLKQALLSQGLCEDVKLWVYAYRQIPLILLIRNTSDEQADACRAVVRRTLQTLTGTGLDPERLQALIDQYEFDVREVNSTRPRGLVYFSMAIDSWLYDGDPAAAFELTEICKKLRDGAVLGLFEKLIRENILENQHCARLTFSPDPCCGEEQNRRQEEALSRCYAALSESEIAALKQHIAALRAYQNRTDTPENKAKIPAVRLADIPEQAPFPEHSIENGGEVTMIRTRPACDGIVYISLCFPLENLSETELAAASLFASLFGKLPTAKYQTIDLQTAISANVGRMEFSVIASERGNYLKVHVAVLAAKDRKAVQLLREVIEETRFDDVPAIGKICKQRRLAAERQAVTQGHLLAISYAAKGYSRSRASQDILYGFTRLRRLQNLSIDDSCINFCREMAGKIFIRKGVILSCSENISREAQQELFSILKPAEKTAAAPQIIIPEHGVFEGLLLESDTGFAGTAAMLPEHCAFHGAMYIAAKILSLEYLHKEIREIGGAYGTAMNISSNRVISCYTYRDPTPVASIAKIRNIGGALLEFVKRRTPLDRYITATIAGMEPYLSPEAEALKPVELYLRSRTPADEGLLRKQVLHTTPEELEAIALMLQEQMAHAHFAAVGGTKQLKEIPADKMTAIRA